ncbi:MAG: hypothetical protein HRT45_10060 [Bdellovibrionales bacterium]|nr:hypothetical protein [Bdellovibrionales bacterium]
MCATETGDDELASPPQGAPLITALSKSHRQLHAALLIFISLLFCFGAVETHAQETAIAKDQNSTPSQTDLDEFGVNKRKRSRSRRASTVTEDTEKMEDDKDIVMSGAKNEKSIKVKWYLPEIGQTKRKRRTRVIIPGKTEPGARLFVNSKAIIVVSKAKKVGYLPTKKSIAKRRVVKADKNGLFALELDLPNYDVQLPIGVVPPGGRKVTRRYQLNLSVERERVRYTNLKVVSKSPAYTKKIGLWFGTGFNYLRYNQTSSTIGSDLLFQTFKGPSYFGKGWLWLSETWDISGTAKMSPGNTSSSDSITVTQGDYEWYIFATEATYYPENLRFEMFQNYKAQLAFRFGVQYHLVPFIARSADSQTTAEIVQNEITMATAGFKFLIREQSRLTYEIFMRYQYPVSSGDVFEITPKFAFDGSLGIVYDYGKNWRAGLFWYGQWHEYDFVHRDAYREANGIEPFDIEGSQSLFFSNIEIRGGYEFN